MEDKDEIFAGKVFRERATFLRRAASGKAESKKQKAERPPRESHSARFRKATVLSSAESGDLLHNRALEGEVVAVGVGDGEAAHVVLSRCGFLQNVDAEGKKLVESAVHIGAAEEERGVRMRGETDSVGGGRALAFVVGGVEHEGVAAAAQHAPMEVVALGAMDDRRVADAFETEDATVELHGCGHIEDLEERAQAVKIERLENSRHETSSVVTQLVGGRQGIDARSGVNSDPMI